MMASTKARQHARGIGQGFAATELHFLRRQHDRLAAELAHADVERGRGCGSTACRRSAPASCAVSWRIIQLVPRWRSLGPVLAGVEPVPRSWASAKSSAGSRKWRTSPSRRRPVSRARYRRRSVQAKSPSSGAIAAIPVSPHISGGEQRRHWTQHISPLARQCQRPIARPAARAVASRTICAALRPAPCRPIAARSPSPRTCPATRCADCAVLQFGEPPSCTDEPCLPPGSRKPSRGHRGRALPPPAPVGCRQRSSRGYRPVMPLAALPPSPLARRADRETRRRAPLASAVMMSGSTPVCR